MTSRTWSRTAMTLSAALALLVPSAALADAPEESGVVERAPVLSAWIFWDSDLVVLTGPPLDEETCIGLATEGFDYEGFATPTSTVVTPPGGTELVTVSHVDRVWVFDDQDATDPLAWMFGACGAILAGGPGPQPLASGEGRVTRAAGHVRVTARVVTSGGDDVHLNVVGAGPGTFPDTINYGG